MALNTFPSDRRGIGVVGPWPVFADQLCTISASLFDVNGKPLRLLTIPESGLLPAFQAAASILYVRADDGTVRQLFPNYVRTMATVTGAKAGNVALTSLLSALAQLGIVVDQTT